MMKTLLPLLLLAASALAQDYLGQLKANSYAPNSTENPYGQYGSPYSPNSARNPYAIEALTLIHP